MQAWGLDPNEKLFYAVVLETALMIRVSFMGDSSYILHRRQLQVSAILLALPGSDEGFELCNFDMTRDSEILTRTRV